ncbi:MAG: hypothetical protein KDB90_13575 [Planctomycetes bacterium]|nr:hypothetical protein [Planctomycetota bacterium]
MPVLIYTSKGTAHDAAMLKEFSEPAWNNPVVRIIDSEKKDVIDRINGVYTKRGIATRLLQAIDKADISLAADARAVLQKLADGKEPSAEEAQQFSDAVSSRISRELDKSLGSAVSAFESKKFGKAAELAAKVRDDEKAEATAKADAEYVIKLVNGRFEGLKAKAEKLKADREYLLLFGALGEAEGSFKGLEGAEEFFEGYDELKKDKAVKEELKALEKLAKLEEKLATAKTDRDREAARASLKDFAEKNPGSRAAEKAEQLAAE